MRPIAVVGAAGAALIGAVYAFQGHAADLGPVYPAPAAYAEPDAQFEFGTGWYLRGDAAFGPEDHPVLKATGFTGQKQDWTYALGGGVGYKFNSFIRFDVTGDWFEPREYRQVTQVPGAIVPGVPGPYDTATVRKYDGLANIYIDLGDWYGVTPYVGAGAGFAVFDPSEHISVADPLIYGKDNTSTRVKFAWAGMAGVSYQFDPNIAVDLGYRHIDLGRFSTRLVGYEIDHHYTEDQVRIGLRYMIF